jgi:polyferredoxin
VRTQEFSEEKIMNLKKLNMVAMIMLIGLGVMLISTFTWIGAQASEGALDDLVTLKAGSATPAVMLTAPMATFTVTNTNDWRGIAPPSHHRCQ